MLSIIIVNYNTKTCLEACITHLKQADIGDLTEIIVVDNASTDGSVAMLTRSFPEVTLITNWENTGFAAANNQALDFAAGDYVLFLNPDTLVAPNAIRKVLDHMRAKPEIGLCGVRLVDGSGVPQPSARRFPSPWTKLAAMSGLAHRFPASELFNADTYGAIDHGGRMAVDWVPGAFALCRREALEQAARFDERFFLYFEETDLCRAMARKGWQVWYVGDAEVVHIGGASTSRGDARFDRHARQNRRYRMLSEWLYFRKHGGLATVLAGAGVELVWHVCRLVKNTLMLSRARMAKARESAALLGLLAGSLLETRFGRLSPPRPW